MNGDRAAGGIEVRAFRDHEDYLACVRLQQEVWGRDFAETVSAALLKVSQKIGGVSAGAFDDAGRLLGFVFGMTGVERGRLVHWSHMLAVRADARDRGIGRRLKEFQRERLRALAVETIYWTFDPLVARNAYLNLNRLAAEVVDYVPDMYGSTGSVLHRLGTDRLVVAWRTTAPPRAERDDDAADGAAGATIVNRLEDLAGEDVAATAPPPLPLEPVIGIEVPADIDALVAKSPEFGKRWRGLTRQAFLRYFEQGYRVTGFRRGADRGCYLLRAPAAREG